MDCQEAARLIDERVDLAREPSPADAGERDWSELDTHLSQCARCRAAYAELLQARQTLCGVAGDEPSNQEIESMWAAIQAELAAAPAATPMASRRRTIRTFVVATLGAAAVLLLAFQLGQWHYGTSTKEPMKSLWLLSVNRQDASAVRFICPSTDQDGDGVVDASEGTGLVASTARGRRRAGPARGFGTVSAGIPLAEQRGVAAEIAGKEVMGTPVMRAGGVAARGDFAVAQDKAGVDAEYRYDDIAVSAGPGWAPKACPAEAVTRAIAGFAEAGVGRTFVGEEFKPLASPELAKLPEPSSSTELEAGVPVLGDLPVLGSKYVVEPTERYAGQEEPVERVVVRRSMSPATIEAAAEYLASADQAEKAFGQQQPPLPPAAAVRSETKVIKTGELGLEVDEYAAAVKRVYALAEEHGGFVADGSSQEQTGGALLGRVVIRVSPERFETLFAALKQIGRVEAENVKAADVTAEYVDLEARIASLQIAEQRLRELMQSKSFMDKISALLEVERELTRVRSEIEQMQGQLRVMADRVALSTIAVTLREPTRTVPSASLSVEVPVLSDAESALGAALAELNGRLTSGQTSKRDDGTLMGDYKLSVSLARFAQLLVAIDGIGRIEARQIKDRQFADVAAPWADKVMCQVALVLYERSRQLPQGVVTLEVKNVADALAGLDPVLVTTEGAVISNQTARRDDGSSVAELDLRVPAGRFADLVAGLEPLGRTTAKQVAGEAGQIVGGAANVQCQVKLTLAEPAREVPSGGMILEVGKFETARQQLSAMIAANSVQVLGSTSQQRTDGTSYGTFRLGIKAADMEAVVSKLESLGRIASRQITGLGLGDLSQADPDALGVVELTLAEKAAISPEPRRAGDSLRERLREGLAGLYASLGLIVYGVILLAPWAVIVLLVAWLITRRLRKRRSAAATRASGS